LPRQIAKFVADIARSLNPALRILLQAASDDASQIAGQVGSEVGDEGWGVTQDR
jgi:hypothetical protein